MINKHDLEGHFHKYCRLKVELDSVRRPQHSDSLYMVAEHCKWLFKSSRDHKFQSIKLSMWFYWCYSGLWRGPAVFCQPSDSVNDGHHGPHQLCRAATALWDIYGWSGGQASLYLHTQDGMSRATLDIQLGPPAAPRPGAPSTAPSTPPCPPPHRLRHHRPARKEQNRQRAAQHQAAIVFPFFITINCFSDIIITTFICQRTNVTFRDN